MSNKTIVITGGAGFIGRITARRLVAQGWRVVALDILDPQVHDDSTPELPEGVDLVRGDMRDVCLVADLLKDADAILHLAAKTGVGQSMYAITDYVDNNVGGTAALLEVLTRRGHRVKRLVVASSRAIYGEGAYRCSECGITAPGFRRKAYLEAGKWEPTCPHCACPLAHYPTDENKPLAPGSIYAVTKRDQEDLCLCLGAAYGIETVALRYFNVYGPGQPLSNPYTGVIPALAAQVLSGCAADVYEDGAPLRDFVHVEDVARANVLALETENISGLAINIGTGEPVTILQTAETVTRVLEGSLSPQISEKFRVGDIRHCYADITRARQTLGYEPSITFEAGVHGMADWLRAQYRGNFSARAANELAARGLLGTAVAK